MAEEGVFGFVFVLLCCYNRDELDKKRSINKIKS